MNINIDFSETIEEYLLTPQQAQFIMKQTIDGLVYATFSEWEKQATQNLKSTRNNYIRGLQIVDEGFLKGSVVLIGMLNNMIESGAGAFDMKNGFKNSSKVKPTQSGGWKLIIPFRFSTPGALGENEIFSNQIPNEIYKIIKGQKSSKTNYGSKVQSGTGLSISNIPQKYAIPKTREAVTNLSTKQTFDAYSNKNSIYAGLTRNEKTYQSATQGTYNTFRAVSNNSDPNSWVHSGISAYNLADRAVSKLDVQTIVDNLIDSSLSKIGK